MKTKYVMGIDYGTNGVRVGIFDLQGQQLSFATENLTTMIPHNGWAEQSPAEWWQALGKAAQRARHMAHLAPQDILGVSYDVTSCTVVACDQNADPLRNAILWMDLRATAQAERISHSHDPTLRITGYGRVSPEWMLPKIMWLKEQQPEIYKKAARICEAADWLGYKLTQQWACNLNNISLRWFYDENAGGWPTSFYERMGVGDVFTKFPQTINRLGNLLGTLSLEAAQQLGLLPGTIVGQGGVDANVGMIGMGAIHENETALVTGTSHLLFAVTKQNIHQSGIWGTYTNSITPGLNLIEGGQISTGAITNWFIQNLCSDLLITAKKQKTTIFELLNAEAQQIPPGSNGLIMTDFWQGNRSPYTDGNIRGLLYGLSLSTTRGEIYRSILEGIAYGTSNIIQTFHQHGFTPTKIIVCGGAAHNDLFLQIHADVANMPLQIPQQLEAPCLGAAILAAVAAGSYQDIFTAVDAMVHYERFIEPIAANHQRYQQYFAAYSQIYPLLAPWMQQVTQLAANTSRQPGDLQ